MMKFEVRVIVAACVILFRNTIGVFLPQQLILVCVYPLIIIENTTKQLYYFFNCGTHCVNAVNLHTYSILLFTKNTEVLVDKSSTHHFNSMFKIIQQTISLITNHTCVCSNCGRYHRTDCYVVIQTKRTEIV